MTLVQHDLTQTLRFLFLLYLLSPFFRPLSECNSRFFLKVSRPLSPVSLVQAVERFERMLPAQPSKDTPVGANVGVLRGSHLGMRSTIEKHPDQLPLAAGVAAYTGVMLALARKTLLADVRGLVRELRGGG
jgi:hypothetical protein